MRINMWMLANMLRDENPIIDIGTNAESDLFGVGFTESPGRVCIIKEGSDILCYSNNNKILMKNCSFMYAFERVQHVFDYYNQWHDNVAEFCKSSNWQHLVDSIYPICQNPIVLFDVNNKVISMSSRFPHGSVDEEWDFLLDYGVASEINIKAGRANPRFLEYLYEGSNYFLTPATANCDQEFLTICIKHADEPWGFISSVSTVNKFSKGEIDSLMALARTVETFLPQRPVSAQQEIDNNVFKEYLTNKDYDNPDVLNHNINSFNWDTHDRYCVMCAAFPTADSDDTLKKMYISALNALTIPIIVIDNRIVFVLNADSPVYDQLVTKLNYLSEVFSATLIRSLCIKDIKNLYYCYDQICFVINNNELQPSAHYDFYDYAVSYIILNSDRLSLLNACNNKLLKLVGDGQKNYELANTLERYLGNERSLQKTAAELNIHKNTITYRIQKAQELVSLELEDPYERMYLALSFTVLKNLGK